jgi:hypothetical protein
MATITRSSSSRIFEPLVGSDALFLDPMTGTANPNQSQSAAAPADPPPASSNDAQDAAPADSPSANQSRAANQNQEQVMSQQDDNPQKIPSHNEGDSGNGMGGAPAEPRAAVTAGLLRQLRAGPAAAATPRVAALTRAAAPPAATRAAAAPVAAAARAAAPPVMVDCLIWAGSRRSAAQASVTPSAVSAIPSCQHSARSAAAAR